MIDDDWISSVIVRNTRTPTRTWQLIKRCWRTYGSGPRVDFLMSQASRVEIQCYNKVVRQNKEITKTITPAVLYLSKQELVFRGHD